VSLSSGQRLCCICKTLTVFGVHNMNSNVMLFCESPEPLTASCSFSVPLRTSFPQPQPPFIRARQVYVSLPPKGSRLFVQRSSTRLSKMNRQPLQSDELSARLSDDDVPLSLVSAVQSRKRCRSPCHSMLSDDGSFSASQSDPETTSGDDSDFISSEPTRKKVKIAHSGSIQETHPPSLLQSAIQSRKRHRSPCHSLFSDDGSFSTSQSDAEAASDVDSDFSPSGKWAPFRKKVKVTHSSSIQRPSQTPAWAIETVDSGPSEQAPLTSDGSNVRVIRKGSFFSYELNGVLCQHTLGSSATPLASLLSANSLPLMPAEGLTLSEKDMDKRCAGLRAHGISMFPPMKAFFCHKHKEFVLPSMIKPHIRNRHTKTLPCGNNVQENFLAHLQQLYPEISDSPLSTSKRHFSISKQISFLPDPTRLAFCPSETCSSVFEWDKVAPRTVSQGFRAHIRKSPSCKAAQSIFIDTGNEKFPQPTIRYAQIAGKSANIQWVFYLPDDWVPPTSPPSIPLDRPLPIDGKPKCSMDSELHRTDLELCQPYVVELGWDKAFPPQYIMVFKTLLKIFVASDASAEEIALQHGLSAIWDFLYGYLESANKFVEGRCRTFRETITKG